jgi:excisionase family DNA binding protein
MAIDRLLYKPAEAADAIGVSRARAYELIAAKVLPSIRVGGSIRVPAEALRAWITKQIEEQREAVGAAR